MREETIIIITIIGMICIVGITGIICSKTDTVQDYPHWYSAAYEKCNNQRDITENWMRECTAFEIKEFK